MSETATRLLSIGEFLVWDDGTDRRHELVRGVPVAMAPAASDHAQIAQNACGLVDAAVAGRRPCRAVQHGGVAIAEGPPGDCFVPDVLMTCEPIQGQHLYGEPRLIVEVLSPSTGRYDRLTKVPLYGRLPSVEEIWLVGSIQRFVQVWQRLETGWHAGLPLIGQARFPSLVLATDVALDDVYALTTL
ncbi:MAG TPA: Uma2 family endonuclease [Geminicoccaceae bacterium]|nr:Uma2 family endonuclease [Geminicoccaceae bacterium]